MKLYSIAIKERCYPNATKYAHLPEVVCARIPKPNRLDKICAE